MGLDVTGLRGEIEAAMARQMPPDEPLAAESIQFAEDLASAIDNFVRGGDVVGVTVTDGDRTLHQTGEGSVQ